ncbi:PASTA domain-containing protein, partial [Asanoa siamensis]|uniref:PASTA domain-containing protein n=1 Tax=Asanoa siamensis TaxID=926357 RepID=UPI0019408F53
EPVDARSDVYAGGCVLFELLCGHPPFVGDSPVSVAYQHVREDPKAPSEINRDVTPPIDAIVLKALSKNPLNRYQSAGEMRADLLRAATGRPVMATPVMREQETMPMGAASAQTTVVRRQQGGPQTRTIPAARVGDAQARKRSNWVLAALSILGVLAVIALVAGLLVQNARGDKIDVANVVGQPVTQAQQALTTAGFTVETAPQQAEGCTENAVTQQDPQGGTRAEKNSLVRLTVCAGPGTVEVPDLKGQSRSEADRALKELKLKPDFDEVNSSLPKDQVISVDKAGTSVKPNTTIKVRISNNKLVQVPDVLNRSRDAAEALLTDKGFKVKVEEGQVVRDENLADRVVDQSVAGGKEAERDSTITITVTVFEEPDEQPTGDPSSPPPGGNNGGIGDIIPGIGGGRPIIGKNDRDN